MKPVFKLDFFFFFAFFISYWFFFFNTYPCGKGLPEVLYSLLKPSEYPYDHWFKFSIRHVTYISLLRSLAVTLSWSFIWINASNLAFCVSLCILFCVRKTSYVTCSWESCFMKKSSGCGTSGVSLVSFRCTLLFVLAAVSSGQLSAKALLACYWQCLIPGLNL